MDILDFCSKKELQGILAVFSDSTGVGCAVLDEKGGVIVKSGNFSSLDCSEDITLKNDKIASAAVSSPENGGIAKNSALLLAMLIKKTVAINHYQNQNSDVLSRLSANIKECSETAEKIQKKTKQLDSIGQQQKLLTINASVEAARTGQSGFALVAQEMGKFAEESTKIYSDIIDLSNTILKNVKDMDRYI